MSDPTIPSTVQAALTSQLLKDLTQAIVATGPVQSLPDPLLGLIHPVAINGTVMSQGDDGNAVVQTASGDINVAFPKNTSTPAPRHRDRSDPAWSPAHGQHRDAAIRRSGRCGNTPDAERGYRDRGDPEDPAGGHLAAHRRRPGADGNGGNELVDDAQRRLGRQNRW